MPLNKGQEVQIIKPAIYGTVGGLRDPDEKDEIYIVTISQQTVYCRPSDVEAVQGSPKPQPTIDSEWARLLEAAIKWREDPQNPDREKELRDSMERVGILRGPI